MHEDLWAGVELKIENAEFFLDAMTKSLQQPARTSMAVIQQSTGAIVDTQWQSLFYAYLDAFLAMARSIPEILQCCFGDDERNKQMKNWFRSLTSNEQFRRKDFAKKFKTDHDGFRSLLLSTARNISLHRTGVPPVEIKITGRFGVSYIGSPIKRVPIAESEEIHAGDDSALQWASTLPPQAVQPTWQDFRISGKPLFDECRVYLGEAKTLVTKARQISNQVHAKNNLSTPP